MKRFLTALMAVSAIFALNSCKEDNPPAEETDGPSIEWPGNSSFATVDITDDLDANLTVTAPAGIKSFVVSVDSEALEGALAAININTTELDLINDAIVAGMLGTLGVPTGDALLNQTEVNFNISSLVQRINAVTTEDSNHVFTVTVSDNNDKTATATCTFHRVAPGAPTMTWEANPNFDVTELSAQMDVKIEISVPEGIASFIVGVDSDALEPVISMVNGGSAEMDLINGSTDLLALLSGVGIPTGTSLVGQTSMSLDLSTLVPLILNFNPANNSNHTFTLNLTDKVGQNLTKAVTFHYTGASSVTVSDVNLWSNTAMLSIEGDASAVAYRVKGTETWNTVTPTDGAYTIVPEWTESKNDAGLTIYTLKEGTGIFAGNTYEFQVNGEVLGEYTAGEGDVIPNGDMSSWTTKWMSGMLGGGADLPYPNADGENFWDSGNNYSLAASILCQEDSSNPGVASLTASMVFGAVFAPGNMYTGDFVMSGASGTAKFGKVYEWNARPSALKVSYKAEVGMIDNKGSYDPDGDSYLGKQDITRIYAVVVDWSAQHSVASGLTTPSGMWDPATQNSVEEGAILGYASLEITGNKADFTDVEIPFIWYDTDSKPAAGNYSIVISCATSNRGDYLTGCSTNKLWIDSFEWVY